MLLLNPLLHFLLVELPLKISLFDQSIHCIVCVHTYSASYVIILHIITHCLDLIVGTVVIMCQRCFLNFSCL